MRRELFESSPNNDIWVEGESLDPDSKTLFTISSAAGEETVLIKLGRNAHQVLLKPWDMFLARF